MKGKPFFDLFTGLRTSMTVAMAIWTALRASHALWTNQMGYISLIAQLPGIYGSKQTLSSGCALGLGSFTAINP